MWGNNDCTLAQSNVQIILKCIFGGRKEGKRAPALRKAITEFSFCTTLKQMDGFLLRNAVDMKINKINWLQIITNKKSSQLLRSFTMLPFIIDLRRAGKILHCQSQLKMNYCSSELAKRSGFQQITRSISVWQATVLKNANSLELITSFFFWCFKITFIAPGRTE